VTTYLDRIIASHRHQAGLDRRDVVQLLADAEARPGPRPFRSALTGPGLAVIAEVKRRSPSAGAISADVDPAAQARAYASGGAAALSVLTDAEFFGGSPADLAAARAAVEVPVLRKDFTVSVADVCDARLMGADAVLLIVAALDGTELPELLGIARRLGLAALVECHDEAEVERAAAAGADLIGVNQRDLLTFEVDTGRALRVAASIPTGVVKVAESGIRSAADAARLAQAGYDAVLVGEALMRAADPAAAVADMRSAAAASVR